MSGARTKQVQVQLVTALMSMRAEPGQQLMILGDVCIGVSTEQADGKGTAAAAAMAGAVKKPQRKADKQPRRKQAQVEHDRQQVLQLLREARRPMDRREMLERLGRAWGRSTGRPSYLLGITHDLVTRNDIVAAGGEGAAVRFVAASDAAGAAHAGNSVISPPVPG